MKNSIISKILLGAMALALGTASVAKANEGVYVSANGGLNMATSSKVSNGQESEKLTFKKGPAIHLAVGYQMDEWRLELEGGYFSNKFKNMPDLDNDGDSEIEKPKLHTVTAMGNLIYNVNLSEDFDWYIGGGLGAARILGFKKSGFAYQALTGLEYKMTESFALTLGYRVFKHSNIKVTNDDGDKIKIKTPYHHTVEAGVRYTF